MDCKDVPKQECKKVKNINISKEYLLLFSHKLYSCLFSLLESDKAENTEIL